MNHHRLGDPGRIAHGAIRLCSTDPDDHTDRGAYEYTHTNLDTDAHPGNDSLRCA